MKVGGEINVHLPDNLQVWKTKQSWFRLFEGVEGMSDYTLPSQYMGMLREVEPDVAPSDVILGQRSGFLRYLWWTGLYRLLVVSDGSARLYLCGLWNTIRKNKVKRLLAGCSVSEATLRISLGGRRALVTFPNGESFVVDGRPPANRIQELLWRGALPPPPPPPTES